jgi:alpha-D-xyloside xylohydrolase
LHTRLAANTGSTRFAALRMLSSIALSIFLYTAFAGAQEPAPQPMTAASAVGGMRLQNSRETVKVTFCGPGVVHVVATPAGAPAAPAEAQPWISAPCAPFQSSYGSTSETAHASTALLTVNADLKTGALSMHDSKGNVLLQENSLTPRRYKIVTIDGRQFYQVRDRFLPDMLEGLYGLGQHQGGVFNYRGSVVELAQTNSDIAVPLLLSTNGYGLLWNTASKSYFDNRFAREMKLTADAADGVDYYFFYGPELDTVIHHYRDLTGHAPLFGEWAYGFIQSKDRYTSAKQLLDIAAEYRTHHVPLDVIVQDWFWWETQGDPDFSKAYLAPYPNVPEALGTLHTEHVHAIISTWAVLNPASDDYKTMLARHLLIPGTPDYDPTNPEARDYYWNHLLDPLFRQGWDGFWLDSSEPETWNGESDAALEDKQLHIGPGALYVNLFPLMHTGNVYDHWRQATEKKRVFLLTRSAFAGQQRNATVEWSGDIFGTFPVLRRQIAAGLNFALSGMPYWTTDIAGYTTPEANAPQSPEYQELYTRWFEFGTFCPILRTHGHRPTNELFSYGAQTPTLIAYDRLRSRMLPYTYSLAWKVTHDDYTMQRPLVMDWRNDVRVRYIDDEFMFGPAFLVSPVTTQGASARSLYLPPAAGWYNFWTGERIAGGRQIQADAPLDRIPLFVKAGSIVPMGIASEYAAESSAGSIELRIYAGADADFDLYSDAGDSYDYEKGEHATIPIHWNDRTRTLTIAARQGSYPGMPTKVTFRAVLVSPKAGAGPGMSQTYKQLEYMGSSTHVTLAGFTTGTHVSIQ